MLVPVPMEPVGYGCDIHGLFVVHSRGVIGIRKMAMHDQ